MTRVFHGPNNIAGAAGLLARKQRELGVDARSICFRAGRFQFEVDQELQPGLSARATLLAAAARFDVFHFYYGESLSGARLTDIRFLRKAGKRVFMYFCGCDLRDSKAMIAREPVSACAECWPMGCAANRIRAVEVAAAVDGVFVSTPDLLEFVPGATLLAQPVDIDALPAVRPLAGGPVLRIAHAPSNRTIKGTRFVEDAVARLQAEGAPVELVLVEGLSHAESLELFASCDLAVDQLLIGSYGQFAVEMMALGRPVIAFIRESLRPLYPVAPPVISATPDTLVQTLRDLIVDRSLLVRMGAAGPAYVREVHDATTIARQALDAYGVEVGERVGRCPTTLRGR